MGKQTKSLTELAGSMPMPPAPADMTPREEAAAKWLDSNHRGYWGWTDALDDARDLLAAVDGPVPDWADLREMARNAGYTHRKLARNWLVWTNKDVYIELRRRHVGGWRIALSGEFGNLSLTDPSPARVLNIARELGIGAS